MFLDLLLFRFPWGFQDRACLVMLCPIHIHLNLLLIISSSIGAALVLCHKSFLLIMSGHLIWRIGLRHELYVWILFVVETVILHFSELYRSTAFTLLLKCLIRVVIVLAFQMFPSCRDVILAFPILICMSTSVPPY